MRVILCSCPPDRSAQLARALVDQGLAACVSIIPQIQSIYRWKGDIQHDAESILLIKVALAQVPACQAALVGMHPYEVPEIIVFTPESVDPAYHAWVTASMQPD